MRYTPETKWESSEDFVWNLRLESIRRGQKLYANDVAVSIHAKHLPIEVQAEIAEGIKDFLNEKYPTWVES